MVENYFLTTNQHGIALLCKGFKFPTDSEEILRNALKSFYGIPCSCGLVNNDKTSRLVEIHLAAYLRCN